MQGLPQAQHDQIGDVDRCRDRPHARQRETSGESQRGPCLWGHAGHSPGDIPGAGGGVLDDDRIPSGRGAGQRPVRARPGRILEGQPKRGGHLPGDPADGQAVTAVRGDGDVEDVVGEVQQFGNVHAERGVSRQHQDAVVVVADAEFTNRTDHAVTEMPVGLARGDGETAGQHRARQRHRHPVTDLEVESSADHPAGTGRRHLDRHPAHVLLLGLDDLDRADLTDDDTGDVTADGLDGLNLETGSDQRLGDHFRRRQAGDGRPEPRHGNLHDPLPVSNTRPKRTSPSTKSRISWTPWRIMAARSRPIPKAKPL